MRGERCDEDEFDFLQLRNEDPILLYSIDRQELWDELNLPGRGGRDGGTEGRREGLIEASECIRAELRQGSSHRVSGEFTPAGGL